MPYSVLHLCNNYKQLVLAVCDSHSQPASTTLVYLEDRQPLAAAVKENLQNAFPEIRFVFAGDSQCAAAFSRLPEWVPGIVRRNISLGPNGRFIRPWSWSFSPISGRRFDRGYVYHSGYFMAKVISGCCDRIVLRESGLNNYYSWSVPAGKAFIRLLSGLPPRRQIWGEESWVHSIEVEQPDRLPASVRGKATKLSFNAVIQQTPDHVVKRVAESFQCQALPLAVNPKTALILSQPIDTDGICSVSDKANIYSHIAMRLVEKGFDIYLKNHPRESAFSLDGAHSLPKEFPIEIWPFLGGGKFGIATALHSAALEVNGPDLAVDCFQLLSTERFQTGSLSEWRRDIDSRLRHLA